MGGAPPAGLTRYRLVGPQRRRDANMPWTHRYDAKGHRVSSACGECRK